MKNRREEERKRHRIRRQWKVKAVPKQEVDAHVHRGLTYETQPAESLLRHAQKNQTDG